MNKSLKKILFLYIILSGFTTTFGEVGKGILGRFTISDVVGGLFLFLFVISYMNKKISIPRTALVYFPVLLAYTIGVIFSLNKIQTLIELLIHYYLVILFIFSFNVFKYDEKNFFILLRIIAIALFIVSFVGIYDLIAKILGFHLICQRAIFYPCAVSTFRNCGQAGAYAIVMVFILLAALSSDLWNVQKEYLGKFIVLSLVFGIVFLLLTVKVASYLGFISGLMFFLISNFKKLSRKLAIFRLSIVFLFIALSTYPIFRLPYFVTWRNWFQGKLQLRFGELLYPEKYEKKGFFRKNWEDALEQFQNKPIFGTGLGGFAGIIEKYEIHSTPLKLLGEGGVVAFLAYLIFMIYLLTKFIKLKNTTEYSDFLKMLFPLFIGLIINWIYTYHLRKREFWILLLVIELAYKYHKDKHRGEVM